MLSVYMKVYDWMHSPPKREQTAVMNYVSKFLSNFKEFYNEINSATLTGAIDVVVVRLEDGSFACSPFHVRFGKIGVLRCREKVVDIEINGDPVDIHMKLGETGEAFFVEETEDQDEEVPSYLATSPIPTYDIQKELTKLVAREGASSPQQEGLDVRLSPGYSPLNNNRNIYDQLDACKDVTASIEGNDKTDDATGHKQKKTSSASKSGDWSNMVNLPPKYAQQGRISVSEDKMTGENVSKSGQGTNYLPQYSTSDQAAVTDDDKQKAKKKRRKRSIVRKRKGQAPGQVTAKADTSDDEPEEIFQMDVDEDEGDGSHSNSSSSTSLQNRKSTIPVSSPNTMQVEKMSNSVIEPSLHARDVELGLPSTSRAPSHSWPYKSSLQLNLEIHPFSDGDVTPIMSPVTSRPPTPKSDTEYEIQKQETASQTECGDNRWSWTWGELPVPPKTVADKQGQEMAASDDEGIHSKHMQQDDDKRSMLGGMFQFMRKTKKIRHQPQSEGIYLDDLNLDELDPETAKLYFPQRSSNLHLQNAADMKPNVTHVKDEDLESGNGSSLPQSPYSMEGGLGNLHGIDSDSEDRHTNFDFKSYTDLAVSLCGGLATCDGEIPHDQFLHSVVTYDDFCERPELLQNPDLVIRLNNKYYNWQTAAPMILSLILYQRPLAERTVSNLIKDFMPKKPKKSETKGYSWGWWRRNPGGEDEPKAIEKKPDIDSMSTPEATILSMEPESKVKKEDSVCDSGTPSPVKQNPEIRVKQESITSTSDLGSLTQTDESETFPPTRQFKEKSYTGNEKFKKTLRLTSEQITHLNLREGPNEVVFSVTTALQGTTKCKCHIYLWNYDDKIVISDIDGTITKSDVLGHILPIIGKDWAQSGVAQLFTKIKNNGYQFLYLSARAIGQAHITREYLKSVRQGDVRLPDGPLLLNPSSLISAFHREVIEKKPEEFKISCLKDIQALFPSVNPFYAGYGNRINDVWAYRAVGIPISRIFTINHKGELKHELTQTFQSTYSGLSYVVDHLFPPLRRSSLRDGMLTSDFEGSDEYSAFTYWRQPIPEVQVDIEVTENAEKAKPDEKSNKVSTST